jgi:hypothetical protein
VVNHRPSTVDRLPEELKDAIGKLRLRGHTIDEILAHIRTMDPDAGSEVSRSALGRHLKTQAAVIERMKLSRDLATTLSVRFEDQTDDKLARVNMELLQSSIMDIVTGAAEDEDGNPTPVTLDPKQASQLASALKDLATAKKTDTDRTLKMRQEIAKEAAKAVKAVAADGGVSADVAQKLWDAVMGVGAAK